MAGFEFHKAQGDLASLDIVDVFIASLRDFSIEELALAYRALRMNFDAMNLIGKANGSSAAETAFDLLQQENDARLDAVQEEIRHRQPEDESEAHIKRMALLDFAAMCGNASP